MTADPTPEQVGAERERAHACLQAGPCSGAGFHGRSCTLIATTLARVRIEAYAAGRDEALREACDALTNMSCTCERAIRALRGGE
jgi:hypothetical protein